MSKLEQQRALPRRPLFIVRTKAEAEAIRGNLHPDTEIHVVAKLPKSKPRKAKKAKKR